MATKKIYTNNDVNIKEIKIEEGYTDILRHNIAILKELTTVSLPHSTSFLDNATFALHKTIKNVIFPNETYLTYIPSKCFYGSLINEIAIPKGIKILNESSFKKCNNLKSVLLPDGLKSIECDCFYQCQKLEKINLPASLEIIGNDAFYGCEKIKNLVIPENVKAIKDNTFYNCRNLEKITLSKNIEILGKNAFYNCESLKDINLESKITEIKQDTFKHCFNLEDITFPKSLEKIDDGAFSHTENLNTIILPENVEEIGENCFYNSGVNFVYMPNKIKSIPSFSFFNCFNLTDVRLPEFLESIGLESFSKCFCLKELYLPKSLTSIEESAFSECSALNLINIPNKITKINGKTFYQCKNLETILISNKLESIGEFAFYECKKLKDITLPKSLMSIGESAFSLSGLESINIPDKVKQIKTSCFYSCKNLFYAKLPKSLEIIDNFAFKESGVKEIIMPDSVNHIGTEAFSHCTMLESIKLSNNITTIPKSCFENCFSLTKINIPNGITTIKEKAFSFCSSLEEIVLPQNIKNIEDNAFCDCLLLNKIEVPPLEYVGKDIFKNNSFNYIYREKENKNIIFSEELPKNLDNVESYIDLKNCANLPINTNDLSNIARKGEYEKILEIKKKLNTFKITFPSDFLFELKDKSLLENFISDSTTKYFYNETKNLLNDLNQKDYYNLFKFANLIGCFSTRKIKNRAGQETSTPIAQKASSFMFSVLTNKEYRQNLIKALRCKTNLPITINPDYDLLKFLIVQGKDKKLENLEFLFDLNKELDESFNVFISNFKDIKNKKTVCDKKTGTYKISWKEAYLKHIQLTAYKNIGETEEDKNLAELYLRKGISQEVFSKAQHIYKQAKLFNTKHHILGKALKESNTIKEIENIKQKSKEILEDSLTLLNKSEEKYFSYEWLDKYDPKNAIMGLYCSCCASILSGCYGENIAEESITNKNLQNLVIKDSDDIVVAKGTLYLNEEQGYGVFNDFEINEKYKKHELDGDAGFYDETKSKTLSDARHYIFDAIVRGINDFVKEYDTQHQDNPIKEICVGMGYNRLKELCLKFEKEQGYKKDNTPLKVPNYFIDASRNQIKLYVKESKNFAKNLQNDIEQEKTR